MWERVTDYKQTLGWEDHGRIIKVGKHKFIRFVFRDMPKYWRMGFDGMAKLKNGWAFRKGDEWFMDKADLPNEQDSISDNSR